MGEKTKLGCFRLNKSEVLRTNRKICSPIV